MDFSPLHTYTPPHCTPDNTGYTYSLSSSYSTAALDFEKEHQINPVYDSPRMSRRSLRLQTSSGFYGDNSLTELTGNHSVGSYKQTSTTSSSSVSRAVRSRRQQQGSSVYDSQSVSQIVTPTAHKDQTLSDLSFTSTASDASLISSLLDQSTLRQSSTAHTYSARRRRNAHSSLLENGDISKTEAHTNLANGYICKDCSFHADGKEDEMACSLPCSTSVSSAYQTAADATMTTSLNSVGKTAHDSYCGSVNVRDLVTTDSHLNLNGSLWKAATGAFWWLGTGWYQLVALMSLINVFLLTRCLPKLLKFLLFLLPLLLLFGLWYLGPPVALYFLPVVNFTELKTAVTSFASLPPLPSLPSLPSFPAFPSFTKEPLVEEQHIPPHVISQAASESINSERLARLEQRVVALWESIQQGELKAKQQHEEAVGLVQALQDQMNTQTDRESLSLWVSQLLEPKFTTLKGEIEREAVSRAETEEQHVQHQTSLEARLAELELLLKNLNSRTEEIHLTQQTPGQAPVSVGVSQEKHDALLSEVQRLEAELSRIRGDLQGVMGCKGKCDQLDTIHETVSAQVKEQLYALLCGRDGGEAEIPKPLLPWLASQYMRSSDLTATLMTLERSILGNLSLQLQESKQQQFSAETVTQTVAHTAGAAGMSEEQVQLIVQRALKLYSEDRTGQVDYALESGGGSILSTRCSETYETKTALMSLFGLPLWYFSQSPRVVIQPDMYPGNCWAFKGSQGYLVIRLSLSVIPTSFCLEHIPKSLSPSGNISSAPQRFSVYGLNDEYQEEGKLLGDYTYQEDGESLQTFPVMEKNDKAFQIIEMRVLSNWGHPEYTCLYRFRVHGKPHTQ
ncbi:SUN domain-containing protein 1-like isoform X1 [Sinocyclocheilus grahami]|uniref:SUN domain-containing protein 1-like isoform X1 n=1 Tax=Sinocyclocheilus grahami TaxID=75366 RepID=UPI0007ACEAFF|nr:PREDICTED: SUN domain-containing protein 1-like isoform X1 [Sinocyclocheilus grahami]